jgi:hypothetical protein
MHRALLISVLLLLVLAPVASGTTALRTSSSGLVISQVYAGGGNAGATYTNDFVELLNRSSSSVSLSGWTLQYAPAGSTNWQASTLADSIPAGHYYLLELASSGSVGAALPAPDATDTTNMAASGGKVALVHDANVLSCGGSAGSCSAVSSVADLVGYGPATDYEGSPAPALSATLAAVRAGNGCTDTDANDADFTADVPSPRNTSWAAVTCSSGSGGGSGVTQSAAVDVDVSSALSLTLEHSSLSFGTASTGQTPAPLGDKLTVVSNSATGYAVSVHRTAFTPADLPLAVSVSNGTLTRIPVAPTTDLLIGTTSAPSAANGDAWMTSFGFATVLPVVPPGHYTSTITFTVIGR